MPTKMKAMTARYDHCPMGQPPRNIDHSRIGQHQGIDPRHAARIGQHRPTGRADVAGPPEGADAEQGLLGRALEGAPRGCGLPPDQPAAPCRVPAPRPSPGRACARRSRRTHTGSGRRRAARDLRPPPREPGPDRTTVGPGGGHRRDNLGGVQRSRPVPTRQVGPCRGDQRAAASPTDKTPGWFVRPQGSVRTAPDRRRDPRSDPASHGRRPGASPRVTSTDRTTPAGPPARAGAPAPPPTPTTGESAFTTTPAPTSQALTRSPTSPGSWPARTVPGLVKRDLGSTARRRGGRLAADPATSHDDHPGPRPDGVPQLPRLGPGVQDAHPAGPSPGAAPGRCPSRPPPRRPSRATRPSTSPPARSPRAGTEPVGAHAQANLVGRGPDVQTHDGAQVDLGTGILREGRPVVGRLLLRHRGGSPPVKPAERSNAHVRAPASPAPTTTTSATSKEPNRRDRRGS